MGTLLLTHADMVRLLDGLSLLAPMRDGFQAHSRGQTGVARQVRAELGPRGQALVVLPGLLPGVPAFTVKVEAGFPGEPGSTRGSVLLHGLSSGDLLAVLDATHLGALSSGIAGAVAADALAREDAARVAIIGAGAQGSIQLKCLRLVRSLNHVRVFDTDLPKANAFAARIHSQLHVPIRVAHTVQEAVEDADIVVTATWAKEPFLTPALLRPGTHVNCIGSDEPAQHELSESLLKAAHLVCDDQRLTVASGALAGTGLSEGVPPDELGAVLSGTAPGRRSPQELTVFTSVGLPFQDLVVAWQAYEGALEDPEVLRVQLPKLPAQAPLRH